jgi:hypothetical protein
MRREIVVFERDLADPEASTAEPKLDFRLLRQALPSGSQPLAVVTGDGFQIADGQFYTREQVRVYAEKQSGYRASE